MQKMKEKSMIKTKEFIKKYWWISAVVNLILILGILGYFVWPKISILNNVKDEILKQVQNDGSNNNKNSKYDDLNQAWSRGKCKGKGMVEFGTLPMRPEDFSVYLPYGLVVDAHVTPIDHGYFSPTIFNSSRDTYEVRAIADGTIVNIGTRSKVVGDQNHNQAKEVEYRLDIEHNCTVYSYFDLVTSLAPDIKEKLDKAGGQQFNGRIPIKEGQLIGRIGGQTLDFAVYNNDVRLNFINPESYSSLEPWKIHTDDPYKYFKEPARSILLSKNPRKVEPRAGKIDYDIAGKAVGNWFVEGTKGYNGINQDRYWDGHLALVPDYIDPTQIRFSIGNFGGIAKQFGVKGNGPDPATIGASTGMVKYELVQYGYMNKAGGGWRGDGTDVVVSNMDKVVGVALIQVLEGEKLKVEVFPGKIASQVLGFTNNSKIYVR